MALGLTAMVNLCDCVEGWSKNVEEQQAIGLAAREKSLQRDPDSPSMRMLKSRIYALVRSGQRYYPLIRTASPSLCRTV